MARTLNSAEGGLQRITHGNVPRVALTYALLCCLAALVLSRVHPILFLEMPATILLLVALSVTLSLSCAGQWYVHHRFAAHDFVQHNDVGGFIIAVTGTLYAVALGFLTVVAWQEFTDGRALVAQESAAATDAWHAAIGLPYANRTRVRDDVLRYAKFMVASEWPDMRSAQFDAEPDLIVMDAIAAAGTEDSRNFMESNSQSATLAQLNVLHDVRGQRISANESAISNFEWLVLSLGAICIVCFCWLFGLANQRIHLLMTATVTIVITSLLVLLFELQYPFRSDLRIPPTSWTAAIDHIHIMQSGSQMDMRM
jgi:hypothetical protein